MLADYIYKIGNYNTDYIMSGFASEGYADILNIGKSNLASSSTGIAAIIKNRHRGAFDFTESGAKKRRYEFIIIPTIGFLGSNDPLIPDCELKLSFDRLAPKMSLISLKDNPPDFDGLDIKDCYALTEYISSPSLRAHYATLSTKPIVYEFEDIEVLVKSLPNDSMVRLDNIRGGNIPSYIFAALIPSADLNGNIDESCTGFKHFDVEEINITVNGNSVSGYPLTIQDGMAIFPLHKFNEATNRLCNNAASSAMKIGEYDYNWLYGHRFEAEGSQGWLSINVKFKTVSTKPLSMVIWIIYPSAITIDKYHQIEKIFL